MQIGYFDQWRRLLSTLTLYPLFIQGHQQLGVPGHVSHLVVSGRRPGSEPLPERRGGDPWWHHNLPLYSQVG